MKGIHPNASLILALVALVVSLGTVGCRSHSAGGMANPFLAPDRVSPPATRAILPGQAQPYYPGDTPPVMQSNAAPEVDAGGLAWNAPGGSSPPADSAPPTDSPSSPASPAFSTEPTVAIPTDNDSLRFALPSPLDEPAPIAPVNPSPIQSAAQAPSQDVLQASYTEPVLSSAAPAPVSPWQPPQISQPALPPPVVQPLAGQTPVAQPVVAQPMVAQPMVAQPMATQPIAAQPASPMQFAAPPNTMNVRLRAVASPPLEPLQSSTPRIRLPSEVVPQSASNDGFRPRGSMR